MIDKSVTRRVIGLQIYLMMGWLTSLITTWAIFNLHYSCKLQLKTKVMEQLLPGNQVPFNMHLLCKHRVMTSVMSGSCWVSYNICWEPFWLRPLLDFFHINFSEAKNSFRVGQLQIGQCSWTHRANLMTRILRLVTPCLKSSTVNNTRTISNNTNDWD